MESEFDKNDIVLQYKNGVLKDHQSKKEILKDRLSEKGFYMYISLHKNENFCQKGSLKNLDTKLSFL